MMCSDLLLHLRKHGCWLKREPREFSFWASHHGSDLATVPKHSEISDTLAGRICRVLGVPVVDPKYTKHHRVDCWYRSVAPHGIGSLEEFRKVYSVLRGAVLALRGEADAFEQACMPNVARSLVPGHSLDDGSRKLTAREEEEIKVVSSAFEEGRVRDPSCHGLSLDHPSWLALAQHQGRSTRLLDVTLNWKKALYFASSERQHQDGFVYCFFNGAVLQRTTTPQRSAIEVPLSDSLELLFDPPLSPIDLRNNVAVLLDIENRNRNQEAQEGRFLWWHPLGTGCPLQIAPIRVRADSKKCILFELERAGISKDNLFPAGKLMD